MPAFVELGYMVYIGVIGESTTNQMGAEIAYEVGRLVALKGALLVSGGLSGVMEHAAQEGQNQQEAPQSVFFPVIRGMRQIVT